MTDMQAAIGVEQIKKLPGFIESRKKNFHALNSGLKKYENFLILPRATQYSDPSWFGFPICIRENAPFKRDEIVRYLENHRIATRMLFGGNLIKQPAYADMKYRSIGSLTNSDLIMNNLFWIGVYPGINPEKIDYILKIFNTFFNILE